jgi:Family of unknown function (DUF5329)
MTPKQTPAVKIGYAAFLVLLWLATPAIASGPSAASQQEIAHLFAYMEGSGCSFYRNGTWYRSKEASDHLQMKYRYLLDKGLVSSAESFIERAASKSSFSGTAYQVQCDRGKPVESSTWFSAELARFRQKRLGNR